MSNSYSEFVIIFLNVYCAGVNIVSITIIAISAVFTAFSFLVILGKMSTSLLKKVLGYEYLLDLVMSFGMMIYFGLTGSIIGMIVAAITGFIFSVALYSAKHIVGYQKLERVNRSWFKWHWVEYDADWNAKSAGGFFSRFVKSIGNFVSKFFSGFKSKGEIVYES